MKHLISEIEREFDFEFPEAHISAMLNESDRIHDACDFLKHSSRYEGLLFRDANAFLRDVSDWPNWLVAFASNGCGDYFAYDVRQKPYRVVYIDPDKTIEENMNSDDKFEFGSFSHWYIYVVQRRAV